MTGSPAVPTTTEPALVALRTLVEELDRCTDELARARARAEDLLEQRATSRSWFDIVSAEERPLIVESISEVLGVLATAGHDWRREQAVALQAEGVSINRIAAMFGVTRQRISTLLRDAGDPAVSDAGTD